ncbi:LysR substrate-binding domain-containing protein [Pseudanabaena sp. FACHB-2040]|uniref:LysR substrate-binding domain-containing protein n=1 Tax=Pseudanabaena sp. FACHB-2040 TaxID=2692859 RepID=UPI0016862242|nr:LysR substrate-binding domain-containing protein [Pseudanabaena sp. FACHB-2040]MBD2258279.1 LysR family transcriptional regulator [Pseudanabaena sp. FACHB-2040]
MELRHLRYFVAVAEELHFGRAAQRLLIAQQPLSRQIRDLEAEIGVELFHRTKRTIRLTEAGHVFLTEARKTLQQAEHAILLAQQTGRGEIGRLVVGFTGPALNTVLPKIVRRFKDKHPQIQLGLERLHTNEQVEALRSQQIQAGLLHPPIAGRSLITEVIHREGLVAILPDSHRLAQSKRISLGALAHEPFILYPRHVGPMLYDRILGLCQQAGFSPRIVQEVVPQQTILGLVAAEIGVSLLHASAEAVAPTGVVLRPLVEPTPELELAVAWNPEIAHPVLPAFLTIVREVTCQL